MPAGCPVRRVLGHSDISIFEFLTPRRQPASELRTCWATDSTGESGIHRDGVFPKETCLGFAWLSPEPWWGHFIVMDSAGNQLQHRKSDCNATTDRRIFIALGTEPIRKPRQAARRFCRAACFHALIRTAERNELSSHASRQ